MTFPLKKFVVNATKDSNSFENINIATDVEIPIEGHCGSFGHMRTYDRHTGVDLYCPLYSPVHAIEDGIVIRIEMFTGQYANSPWWNDTIAVHVQGESGVFVYGELYDCCTQVGRWVVEGQKIGEVGRVLKKDKGRPTTMLHMELWSKHYNGSAIWREDKFKDQMLYDPTPILLDMI